MSYSTKYNGAHAKVALAIRNGVLTRQPCIECGSTRVDAHHTDYSQPLEVIWLCPTHHKRTHRELRRKLKPARVIPVPRQRKSKANIFRVNIEETLFNSFDLERRENHRTMKELVEWGMKLYLLHMNPEKAKELGISATEE